MDLQHEEYVALDAAAWAMEEQSETLAAKGLLMSSLEMAHFAGVLRRLRERSLEVES